MTAGVASEPVDPGTARVRNDRVDRVAVIIPCRDVGDLVRHAVRSATSQADDEENLEVEVIVVDDRSEDPATLNALAEIAGWASVQVLPNERKPGVSGARNTGIAAATADWISYLDADDMFLPGALRTRLGVLDHFPGAEWVGTDFQRMFMDGSREERNFLSTSHGFQRLLAANEPLTDDRLRRFRAPLYTFVEAVLPCTITTMITRRLQIETGGFDEELHRAEDVHMWLRLAQRADFYFLPQPTALYLMRPGSATHSGQPPGSGRLRVYRKLIREGVLSPRALALRRRINEHHLMNVTHFRRNRQFGAAINDAIGAVWALPWSYRAWKALLAACTRRA